MQVVVLDAGTLGADTSLAPLKNNFHTVIYEKTEPQQIAQRVQGFDVVVVNKLKINAETLQNARPKLICLTATGYDNVDLSFCKSAGIAVCNVVGYSTESVAQVTLSMVLTLFTHLTEYTSYVNNGLYTKSGFANCVTPTFHTLFGKTWGIIGFGNIGKRVAEIAQAMGCKILVHKKTPVSAYPCVPLHVLLEQSDIVSLHTPLNDETYHLINETTLAAMKSSAVLVNVARGAVCDEQAVANAVLTQKIAAFGADVYAEEPFSATHPYQALLGRSNVCLTPHMAWAAYEARALCIEEIYKNIIAFQNNAYRNRVDQ